MERLFLTVFNMSLSASCVILLVLLLRLLMKRLPKIFSYLLWLVVLFRLLCPFSFESAFSLVPIRPNTVPTTILLSPAPQIESGIAGLDNAVNGSLPAPNEGASMNPMQFWVFGASVLWSAGVVLLLGKGLLASVRLKKQLASAVPIEGNVWLLAGATTPFVFGLLRPKIYLPPDLPQAERCYLLRHEQTHIRRKDHWVKLLGYFAVCLHWANPLVWLAFRLLCEDMELSCDERVIRELGSGIKREYSASLLSLSTGRRSIGSSPLAFGENNTKGRIKNVLRYKKLPRAAAAILLALVALLGIALLANPVQEQGFSHTKQLFANKTPYVGDNSKVGALIAELSLPETTTYDHFELKTDETPYRVKICLNATAETRENYSEVGEQWPFRKNAYLLFALIDNLDEVSYLIDDGARKLAIYVERTDAETALGCAPGVYAESEEKLAELLALLEAGEREGTLPEEPTVEEIKAALLARGLTESEVKTLFHLSLSPEELLALSKDEARALLEKAKQPGFIT